MTITHTLTKPISRLRTIPSKNIIGIVMIYMTIICCMPQLGFSQSLIQHLSALQPTSIETDQNNVVTRWNDLTANNNDATAKFGAVYYPSANPSSAGIAGLDVRSGRNALRLFQLDNSVEWLDFNGAASGNSGFSVLVAFQAEELMAGDWNDVIGNTSSMTSGGFAMRYNHDGQFQVILGTQNIYVTGAKVKAGESIVMACNYDATTEVLSFWDSKNQLIQTLDAPKSNFTSSHIFFGSANNSNRYMEGSLGEVKVYDGVLSDNDFKVECSKMRDQWAGIQMPVEVLGAQGTISSRTFTLDAEQVSSADRFWLRINNLSYENKASIKVNDGGWYDLNHGSVDMQYQEKTRGGMVHGGFNTIRFSVPATGFVEGENTVYFRFNHSDGISNGYRVINFNLLDGNGYKLLDEGLFHDDDAYEWVGPYNDVASIEEGKDLWYNGTLITNYLEPGTKGAWYAYELDAAQPMKATCSDCHTQDGRDLELFAYSNSAIIERAKFHHMSEEDGRKIASYIRSLTAEHENVNRHGRPWNPPYQPGPELEGKSIDYWAAGAGLDAVLDTDKEMLPYMFPNGVTEETVQEYFDQDTPDIDRTTLPLAIQFPDWKHWLPMVHPKDAFTKGDYYQKSYDEFTDYIYGMKDDRLRLNPEKGYEVFRAYLDGLPKSDGATISLANMTQEQIDELKLKHENFRYSFRFYIGQGGNETNHWRVTEGKGYESLSDDIALEFALTSMARLMAVKNFEFMQEFNLQDQAPDHLLAEDFPTRRQWLHGHSKHVFEVPAHITGCQDGDCQTFQGQPKSTGQYESSVWYHLQGILAGGEGEQWWNGPVDYNYHPEFILSSSKSSGIDHILRYYHSIGTMYKTKTWSGDISPDDGMGFRIRVQGPWYFLGKEGDGGSNNFLGHEPGYWPEQLDKIQPGMTKMFLDVLMKEFLKAVRKHSIADWQRWEPGENRSNLLDPIEKTTLQDVTGTIDNPEEAPLWADQMHWVIQESIRLGVECQTIEEMIEWCEEAFPNVTWSYDIYPSLKLRFNDNAKLYSELEYIEALPSSGGDNPTLQWYVNGELVDNVNAKLPTADLVPGDMVTCVMTSNAVCVGTTNATAQIGVPTGIMIQSRRNNGDWNDLGNTVACVGDVVDYKIDLDTKPIIWLDAFDISATDGASIDNWTDRSGNANDAVATVFSLAPTYDADGMNGLPALKFGESGGSVMKLIDADDTGFMEDEWTVFIVHQFDPIDTWSNTIGNKNNLTGDGWYFRLNGDGRTAISAGDVSLNGNTFGSPSSAVSVITKDAVSLTSFMNGRFDVAAPLQSGDKMTNGDDITLGQTGYSTSQSRYHQGYIAEVIVYDYAMSANEREVIEAYLAHKWKLTAEIAEYSVFKNASPIEMGLVSADGTAYNFDRVENVFSHSVADGSDFGNFIFTPAYNTSNTYQASVIGSDNLVSASDAIAYSVNGNVEQTGLSVTVFEGDEVKVRPNYILAGDYQWVAPDGQELTVNTDIEWVASASHAYNGTWILKVLGDDCSATVKEIEFELEVLGSLAAIYQQGVVAISQSGPDDWTTVTFPTEMADIPILVAGPLTYNGSDPSTFRIRSLTKTGFEVQVDEWDYLNGIHNNAEHLNYFAVLEGTHNLGGLQIEAGKIDVRVNWLTQSFNSTFSEAPVVLTAQVTEQEATASVQRLRNVSATGFEIMLQEEEAADQVRVKEEINFIAFAKGTGMINGNLIQAGTTGTSVTNKWYTHNFSSAYTDAGVLAQIQTTNDEDPVALRQRNVTDSSIQFKVDEEKSLDSENAHDAEEIGWVRMANFAQIGGASQRLSAEALGLEETNLNLQIFPNPAKNKLNIVSSTTINRVEVADITGRSVLKQDIGSISVHLALDNYESGLYLFKVYLEDGQVLQHKVWKK